MKPALKLAFIAVMCFAAADALAAQAPAGQAVVVTFPAAADGRQPASPLDIAVTVRAKEAPFVLLCARLSAGTGINFTLDPELADIRACLKSHFRSESVDFDMRRSSPRRAGL